jgi:hypothetical protein
MAPFGVFLSRRPRLSTLPDVGALEPTLNDAARAHEVRRGSAFVSDVSAVGHMEQAVVSTSRGLTWSAIHTLCDPEPSCNPELHGSIRSVLPLPASALAYCPCLSDNYPHRVDGVPGCRAWTPPLFMRVRAVSSEQGNQAAAWMCERGGHPPRRLLPQNMSSNEIKAGQRLGPGHPLAPVRPSSEPLPPQILDQPEQCWS